LSLNGLLLGDDRAQFSQPSKHLENIRLSDELRGTKDELLRVTQELGLEGLVAKRRSSVYESGRGSGAWVKYKFTKSQEFVIGGYTLPEGGRKYFGSLLVGYPGTEGLLFAGRVGPGFRPRRISMRSLKTQGALLSQDAAQAQKAGLWQDPDPVPPWEWRGEKRVTP